MQVFGRVGNIQDVHVNPGKQSGHTYGSVLVLITCLRKLPVFVITGMRGA